MKDSASIVDGARLTRHVDLVGVLFVAAGALSLVMALSLFALGLGALSLVRTPGSEVPASVVSLLFGLAGAAAAVLGVTGAITGAGLRRRRPWARLWALAVAILSLCVLPFGTALGVYALWVLLHEGARAMFHPTARPQASQPERG